VPTKDVDGLRARVDEVPYWFHSIDLGGGVVTPGLKTSAWLQSEFANLGLGDLSGKSVLDVGSWDGYYAFAAERMGAQRVVALDHYAWSSDLGAWEDYRRTCVKRGQPVAPAHTLPEVWKPDTLPGRRGFDVAHAALNSKVEVVVVDLMDCDLHELGSFDVVLYLGLLYHMKHPMLALERVAQVTRGTAIIETQADAFRASERQPLCRFYEGDELNNDPSNWWTFNEAALLSMCRAAGFSRAEILHAPPRWKRRARALVTGSAPFRAFVRATH